MDRAGTVRRVGLGLAALALVLGVTGLWRWSTGAADPVAPGGAGPPGLAPGAGAVGDVTAGQAAGGSGSADGATDGRPGTGDPEALATVRAAAGATAAVPAMHFTLGIVLADGSTTPPATEVSGVVDTESGDVSVTLREWVAGVGSAPTTLEALAVGDALYVRSSSLGPPGGSAVWWRLPVDAAGQGTPAMVTGLVAFVGSARSAEPAGTATVDGTEVRRLRVELPSDADASAVLGSASGWGVVGIDGDGYLRSIEVRAVGAWGQAAGREVLVRLVLDRLGDPVEISAPDPAAVREPDVDAAVAVGAAVGAGRSGG